MPDRCWSNNLRYLGTLGYNMFTRGPSQYKDVGLPIEIPMLKIRQSHDRLSLSWESPYMGKTVYILRQAHITETTSTQHWVSPIVSAIAAPAPVLADCRPAAPATAAAAPPSLPLPSWVSPPQVLHSPDHSQRKGQVNHAHSFLPADLKPDSGLNQRPIAQRPDQIAKKGQHNQ